MTPVVKAGEFRADLYESPREAYLGALDLALHGTAFVAGGRRVDPAQVRAVPRAGGEQVPEVVRERYRRGS